MRLPRVELVCVGSELLMGKVNAHGSFVAQELDRLGLPLVRETVVSDDPADMRAAFREVWRRADVVLCTGGLGPTFDDLTRDVWSRVTGRRLRFRPDLDRDIAAKFRRRGLRMPPMNRRQALVLDGAVVLPNQHGTAPGQVLRAGRKILVLFPGPAREFHPLWGDFVPFLRKILPPGARETRVYRIFGLPESTVDEKLRSLIRREKSLRKTEVVWGILAQRFIIDIKVTISAPRREAMTLRLERIELEIRRRFGRWIFGTGRETLEEVVGRLLRSRRETLATAESCTGGLLAHKVTRVPGSSDYFLRGYVTYSNASKRELLGVRAATLAERGAVSAACAKEMALGCRRRARADRAVAITGIAGPSGGTPEKPVGLVHIALAGPRGVLCRENRFDGDREQIRERSALQALDWLRRELER